MKKSILLIIIIIFTSCNRELRRSISIYEQGLPLPYTEKVIIIPEGHNIPDGYTMVGICSYGEAGWTATKNCTYEAITNKALEDARNIGATLIYIAHVKAPSFESTCYNITVHFYKKNN